MNSRIIDTSSSPLSTNYFIHMALLLWGLAWFAMSVVIFTLGWVLPQLRSKPPPLVVKPRSPSIPSEPLSPMTTTTDLVSLEKDQDDVVSTKSTLSDLPSPPLPPASSSPSSSKRSLFKPPWSFSATRKSSRPSSRKSSLGSAGSLTLLDNSPPSYVPDLDVTGNESGAEARLDQDLPSSSDPSPSDSPRPARNVRAQSLKLLKNLSRKVSAKQRPPAASSRTASPVVSTVPLAGEFCESVRITRRSQSRDRPSSSMLAQPDEPGPQQKVDPLSGEVFTTSFVNPFRIKPRKPKPSLASNNPTASSAPAPAPRRASGPRRMLNSLQLTLASNSSHTAVSPAPDSPRSSISSASTSTFSGSSIRSALSGSSDSPRGVRRTQPYAAPYYAAMPGPAGTSGTSARRRAASCTREWRPEPEPVEEEQDEDVHANALGLEFVSDFGQRGRGRGSTRACEVQTEPHRGRNGAGHRAAASESAVVLASAR
ncbi:hypothetical protein GSI_06022 [Ganoderma sinense ZZ0214-1]|uniref:Uncharacterized protein n=1 Tax=Ganoderma sinense ZZ0214-1 TaxID=1077348 RepID=A0A2G8SC39_9APHY|nr:hypothetical protein GSI_06022 [Ganoderma sinense ZZ0214-1]